MRRRTEAIRVRRGKLCREYSKTRVDPNGRLWRRLVGSGVGGHGPGRGTPIGDRRRVYRLKPGAEEQIGPLRRDHGEKRAQHDGPAGGEEAV